MPLAFVDMDLLDQNIRAVIQRAGGKKIRIASKSIRCVAILRYIQNFSEQFQGIMCYNAREALYLCRQGFDDLLVAYPLYNSKDLYDIGTELRRRKQIIFMVDSIDHLACLEKLGNELQTSIPVCIDIDMSVHYPGLHFGVLRSGIRTPEQALDFYQQIQKYPHIFCKGIMGYEAQIAGVSDYNPARNFLVNACIRLLKKNSIPKISRRRRAVVEKLKLNGAKLEIVNGGGTGSLETTGRENLITEVTAGSAFFAPSSFDYYHNFQHLPAMAYAIEITAGLNHIFSPAMEGAT